MQSRTSTSVGPFVCNAETTDGADKPDGWTSDKWATPWPVLRDLEQRFGGFDLDPCCEPHTAKAPTFYTVEDDGLSKPWFGNVFVNPPYSNPRVWCERALEATSTSEAAVVVMLLPCATDTAWFHEIVWPNAELHFIRGRVRFLGWRGTPLPSPRAPSLVAVFRAPEADHCPTCGLARWRGEPHRCPPAFKSDVDVAEEADKWGVPFEAMRRVVRRNLADPDVAAHALRVDR